MGASARARESRLIQSNGRTFPSCSDKRGGLGAVQLGDTSTTDLFKMNICAKYDQMAGKCGAPGAAPGAGSAK